MSNDEYVVQCDKINQFFFYCLFVFIQFIYKKIFKYRNKEIL